VNIYKIVVEYNGKNFYGSQIQGSLRTVEGVLKDVLSQLLNKKFKLVFVSRTDRGVHSLCNIAKLSCNDKIDTKTFLEKINFLLPKDLQVKKILSLKKDFNPRKVKYKIYQYTIYNSKNHPTLYSDYVWWIIPQLAGSKLKKAAKIISSQKNFSFATTKDFVDTKKSVICKIEIKVSKFQDFIKINFKGSRFLHRLVRNIVALLVEVGKGNISFEELKDIIKNWKYCKLKPAPPQGLVLLKIVI
jgi:tRNA pseudouridine38-40 synthase